MRLADVLVRLERAEFALGQCRTNLAYPAAFIDCAYLPEGSPLQNRVPGQFQGIETIGGRRWQHVSIHPYTGNGTAWNKDRHGFHTYYDEMLSWLYKAN